MNWGMCFGSRHVHGPGYEMIQLKSHRCSRMRILAVGAIAICCTTSFHETVVTFCTYQQRMSLFFGVACGSACLLWQARRVHSGSESDLTSCWNL